MKYEIKLNYYNSKIIITLISLDIKIRISKIQNPHFLRNRNKNSSFIQNTWHTEVEYILKNKKDKNITKLTF